jgi:hypothetical protein
MAVMVALVAVVATAFGDDEASERWLRSLPDAQRRAIQERKPLMAVFLDGERASVRFERSLGRDRRLPELLDQLVCVKLDPADHADLVDRYHMETLPAVLFLTPAGRPIKLMVGITSTAKVRGQAKEALAKYARISNPAAWQPTQRKKSPPPRLGPRRPHRSSCPTECEFCEPAIERALSWLARRQGTGGNWRKPDDERESRTADGKILTRSIDHIDTSLTALAGFALLTTGSTPGKGPYGEALRKARSYLRRAIRDDGAISAKGDEFVYHVHAIFETSLAAMFLAETLALDPDPALAERLALVAASLAEAQDERSGAWGYAFDSTRHPPMDKRGWRLLATTHCAVSALNALRDAGVTVDQEAIARGVGYLESCVARDGNFAYRSELRRGAGHPGASTGALFAIARSGVPATDAHDAAWRRVRETLPDLHDFGEHWWFFQFFTSLAVNDRGEGSWRAYHEHYRDVILANQDDDGSFADPDGKAGSVFATSIALFVLQLRAHPPTIAGRRTGEREVESVPRPRYLKPPNPLSRVKVFEHEGAYLADLIVSVDGPADAAYLEQLAEGLRGASRILFDVTDGQVALHRVTILDGGRRADEADLLVTSRFHEDPDVPRGGAHGITMVTKRTEVRGGREIAGKRIGEWVKLPFALTPGGDPVPWHHVGLTRVIAHELCHYLFGVQDEYGVGGHYCTCIVGDNRTTELCTDATHSDDRRERSCWAQAVLLYPGLRVPVQADPGPWDPPRPRVTIHSD